MTTPQISPCGCAVDVLRSCHSSTWRFYAGNPEKLTRGYFYFVPRSTPALPYFSDFYSATWTHGDEQAAERTGPLQFAARPWRNGRLGISRPPAIPFGRAEQFEGGLSFPGDVNHEQLRNGITLKCWTNVNVPFEDFDVVADTNNCCLRSAYTQILELLYAANTTAVQDFFEAWLGPQATLTFVAVNGLIPAMGFVTTGTYTLAFITGTTQFQQLALQALQGLAGPENFGNVATAQIFWDLSSAILAALEGIPWDPTKPLFLCGHSFGAAGCAVIAVRLTMAHPERVIRLMTFGMPKCVDNAGMDHLQALEHVFVANQGDIVTTVPLSPDQIAWFQGLVPQAVLDAWVLWTPVPSALIQAADGTKRMDVLPSLGFNVLLPVVIDAITGQPIAPIEPHLILEYQRRSCLMCGCPDWPFSAELWDMLFPLGCPPAVLALNAPQPARGALAMAELPKVGGDVGLVGKNQLPGRLKFDTVDKNDGAQVLLLGPKAIATMCGFCPDLEMPFAMKVTLSCPSLPDIDGQVFTITLEFSTGVCQWIVINWPISSGQLSMQMAMVTMFAPDLYFVLSYFADNGDSWSSAGTTTSDWGCFPFLAVGSDVLVLGAGPVTAAFSFQAEPADIVYG